MSIRLQRFALLLLLPCVGACASVSPFGGATRPGRRLAFPGRRFGPLGALPYLRDSTLGN